MAVVCALVAASGPAAAGRYEEAIGRVAARRAALAERWAASDDRAALVGPIGVEIASLTHRVARRWLGTRTNFADDDDGLVPPLLELPDDLHRHGMAEGDIGRGGVHPHLDPVHRGVGGARENAHSMFRGMTG